MALEGGGGGGLSLERMSRSWRKSSTVSTRVESKPRAQAFGVWAALGIVVTGGDDVGVCERWGRREGSAASREEQVTPF